MDHKKQVNESKSDKPIFNPCASAESTSTQPKGKNRMPDAVTGDHAKCP